MANYKQHKKENEPDSLLELSRCDISTSTITITHTHNNYTFKFNNTSTTADSGWLINKKEESLA